MATLHKMFPPSKFPYVSIVNQVACKGQADLLAKARDTHDL